jgi:hypothetical protein
MSNISYTIKKGTDIYQLRVESCIGTILALKNKIKHLKNIDPVFLFQFNRLEAIIPQLRAENITKTDVERIERATNNLFNQMKPFFKNSVESEVYNGLKH